MRAVVLVPFRAADAHRARIWAIAHASWELPVIVADDGATDGPFCKARAVNRAAASAGDWDVAVIADADLVVPAPQVARCVERVAASKRAAHPFDLLHRLSRDGTERILAGELGRADWRSVAAHSGCGFPGGVIVVHRWAWRQVGGMDERFVGWGGEDNAFRQALRVLAGPVPRLPGESWHLWHPGAPTRRTGPLYAANRELWQRYRAADRRAMRLLIAERSEAAA